MGRNAWAKALGNAAAGGSTFGVKGHKYGAKRTTTPDGEVFDSKGESDRWAVLKQAEWAGIIVKGSLERQPRFPLVVNGVKVCEYRADFKYTYRDEKGINRIVVEDYKGMVTPVARLKLNLFEAVFGYPVKIVTKAKEGIG